LLALPKYVQYNDPLKFPPTLFLLIMMNKLTYFIRGLQTFVEWVHLVLNLQFGKHVSFHKHSMKGINAASYFKSPCRVLHRAEVVFYWMSMCPYSLKCWCMGQSTNSVHPMFWVLGCSNYWLLWTHLIDWGSIQCQIRSACFITIQQLFVTHYCLLQHM
jgi:hypothetical protein